MSERERERNQLKRNIDIKTAIDMTDRGKFATSKYQKEMQNYTRPLKKISHTRDPMAPTTPPQIQTNIFSYSNHEHMREIYRMSPIFFILRKTFFV